LFTVGESLAAIKARLMAQAPTAN